MNRLIQVFSFLAVLVGFSVVSAKAQAVDIGGDVQIPFGFSLNDRDYEAGTYRIKVARLNPGSVTITIIDPKNDRTQMVLAQRNGDESTKQVDIVFGRVGDKRTFDRIVTPEGGFAVNGSRQRVH